MINGCVRSFTCHSPDETTRFAAALAPLLSPGNTILLDGPIGAGKTHFARAVIQTRLAADGRLEDVPSPTYTLVQTYDDGHTEMWHADLYRLTHTNEVEELGLIEAFDTAICLVEWPDRLGELAQKNALHLGFRSDHTKGVRHLTATTSDARWTAILDKAIEALNVR